MFMPRLSLYRPEKGNDYKFIDKTAWEMFQVGGTDVLLHKYIGPGEQADGEYSPTVPNYESSTSSPETRIQDMLFLENRDRKYEPDVYPLRGVYNVNNIDFNLSQFGLFLQNDTLFVTFHINDTVEKLGRKIMAGDVIELPHLKDEFALNDLTFALKRFYVIEEVNRAAEGFSVTWYPHLYRAKCTPLVDSQEFKQILDKVADDENFKGKWNPEVEYEIGDVIEYEGTNYTVIEPVIGIAPPDSTHYKFADRLRDIMSTYEKEMQITEAVQDQAEADAPHSGYDTTPYYTVPIDETTGHVKTVNVSNTQIGAGQTGNAVSATTIEATPVKDGYQNYHEDAVPPNGAPFTQGIIFPGGPVEGQFCLRTDYHPKRLFRFDGKRWVKYEDNVRMTMSQNNTATGDPRLNQKGSFINNPTVSTINGKQVDEKQSLSKVLKPKADN